MARTALTIITPKGPYPGTVAAEALDFVWGAGDATNENDFIFTGRELILVRNDNAAAKTIGLVSSVAQKTKRTADIAAYSVGIGEYACFWPGNPDGWNQSGKFHLDCEDDLIKYAIIRIPG